MDFFQRRAVRKQRVSERQFIRRSFGESKRGKRGISKRSAADRREFRSFGKRDRGKRISLEEGGSGKRFHVRRYNDLFNARFRKQRVAEVFQRRGKLDRR